MTLKRPQLSISLLSEVTSGSVTLLISNGRGDPIGKLPVKDTLTTNKWQMISFTADVKSGNNQQISFQVCHSYFYTCTKPHDYVFTLHLVDVRMSFL